MKSQKPQRYRTVSAKLRLNILEMLIDQGLQPSYIGRELGINVSTIKAIHRVYKKEGRRIKKAKRDCFTMLNQKYAIIVYGVSQLELISKYGMLTNLTVSHNQKIPDIGIETLIMNTLKDKEDIIQEHLSQLGQVMWTAELQQCEHNAWENILEHSKINQKPASPQQIVNLIKQLREINQEDQSIKISQQQHEINMLTRKLLRQFKQMLGN